MTIKEQYPNAKFINQSERHFKWIGHPKGSCIVGKDVALNDAVLDITGGIMIKDRVHFGREVMVLSCSHPPEIKNGLDRRRALICKPILIEEDVCVGSRAIILPGVVIGRGAYIASGAVVSKDVLPHTLVGGVPAKLIREL